MFKKVLSILIAVTFILSFAGCSKDGAPADGTTPAGEDAKTPVEEVVVEKIVSSGGTEFAPDLTVRGETANKALNVNEIDLCGKTYSFPIKIKDLMADGWELNEITFKDEFAANTKTRLSNFNLTKEDNGNKMIIYLETVYNATEDIMVFEDTELIEFSLRNLNTESDNYSNFVLPGGITGKSTAGDVAARYGDPNNNENFVRGGNYEKQLNYTENKESGLSFIYLFNDDATVRQLTVRYELK